MNIYAIRDRLLNYYQQPFAAPEDKAVLAALSRTITNGGDDVICQAPQHFEIWRLGKVEETGHITGRPEFLADLNSLIRARREPTIRGAPTMAPPESYSDAEAQRRAGTANADQRAPESPTQATDRKGTETPPEPRPAPGMPNDQECNFS